MEPTVRNPVHENLSAMHRAVADRLGPRAALRFKRHGLYHDLSYDDYRRQADRAAAGLVELGGRAGDRVAILAENRPEWLIADIAILATGGVDVPLHAPLSANQVQYQIAHSEARAVLVSNQAQADKVLAVLDRLPSLEFLVSFEPVNVAGRLCAFTWDGLKQLGQRTGPEGSDRVREREAALGRADLATIIYTSGTTGPPKGVMLSHGNLLSNAEAMLATLETEPTDVLLSWLPYSHIYARTVDHYLLVLAGGCVALAESPETLIVNLAETQPSQMTSVPRFYEKVWASVQDLSPEDRNARLRKLFGARVKRLSSGGAPLPRHVNQGFIEAGLPLLEGYGLTESAPVISFNRHDHFKVGSVGQAIPGVEVKIAEDGEILTRGPHVMSGYWKDPEATRAALVDGWLHTGDVGLLDDEGFLTITDRKKELIVTSWGKNVAPAEIERLLVSDLYIDQAVVHGDKRPFVSALIVPDFVRLQAQAEQLGCRPSNVEELVESEPVHAFMAERIAQLMEAVSQPERVKRFVLLSRPFQLDLDELTPTLKVRRRHILEKHRALLDRLYDEPGGPSTTPANDRE